MRRVHDGQEPRRIRGGYAAISRLAMWLSDYAQDPLDEDEKGMVRLESDLEESDGL